METQSLERTNDIHISLDLKAPNNIDITKIKNEEIQNAFTYFFTHHPIILEQILETLEEKQTQNEKRKKILASLKALGDDDLEWTDEIIPARRNKPNAPNIFDDK